MTHRWHIAFTDSRAEQDSCAEIRDIGFDAFTPMERHKRFTRGRKVYYEQALFPRYLFARFDSDDPHWASILDLDGVCDVLSNNGEPSPVERSYPNSHARAWPVRPTKAPNPFPPGTAWYWTTMDHSPN
jgi:transcription antitermination factor NusG